jgi:hypothetical protein
MDRKSSQTQNSRRMRVRHAVGCHVSRAYHPGETDGSDSVINVDDGRPNVTAKLAARIVLKSGECDLTRIFTSLPERTKASVFIRRSRYTIVRPEV